MSDTPNGEAIREFLKAQTEREAERLRDIGIKDGADLTHKYAQLCTLYELAVTDSPPDLDLHIELADTFLSSDDARRFADRVLEIMHGAPWRDPT